MVRMEMGEEPLVKTVAYIFKQLCYDYRDQLTAGIIVAGWDKRDGGQVFVTEVAELPNLCQINIFVCIIIDCKNLCHFSE